MFSVNVFAVDGFDIYGTCNFIYEDSNGDYYKFAEFSNFYKKEIIKRNSGIGKNGVTADEIHNTITRAYIKTSSSSSYQRTFFMAQCITNMEECAGKYCRN